MKNIFKKFTKLTKETAYVVLKNKEQEIKNRINSGEIEESEGINLILQNNLEYMKQHC